ncbi:hypothetical protein K2F40_12370 [Clostridium sp. CM028]|nr:MULTISPECIES: hypothetical protein [unclassified Clostridium]MBW9149754.1 hypothetical protein [Clostridium sp. CM028]UVE42093.1 hypothetical protein KTC92_06485 [Clostridium sp. CM027]WAG71108.1 hypothetical protein LL036_06705 [Clostridium sp. CF011]WLC62704.1 hypothetical protein KTC94_05410 [Clostridium sp. CM028]
MSTVPVILGIDELTCMVVTHKLVDEVLRMYDGIIVANNGRIEEIGNFDELTQKKGYCPTATNGSNAFFLFPKIDDK